MRCSAVLAMAVLTTFAGGCTSAPPTPGGSSPEAAAALYLSHHEAAVNGDPEGYRRMWDLFAPDSLFRYYYAKGGGFPRFQKWLLELDPGNRTESRIPVEIADVRVVNDTFATVELRYTLPSIPEFANQTFNDSINVSRQPDGTWKLHADKCCSAFYMGLPAGGAP